MIDCSKEIGTFYAENVRLSQKQQNEMRQRRKANQDRLKSGLVKKGKPVPGRHIKQGSYAMHTMVLPRDADPTPDYDIDDGAVFCREALKGLQGGDMVPHDAREMVRDALDDGSFNTPPKSLKNCVRVFYETGYHVDIPVYREFKDDKEELVLELASSEWRVSDPTELTDWFNSSVIDKSTDETNGRQMRRALCLLKKFARSRKSWNLPSGLILSVLADEAYRSVEKRDDDVFYYLMQSIYGRLVSAGHQVYNPCDTTEELTKGKDDPKLQELEDRLAWALSRLKAVKSEPCDKKEALKRWNDIFGTDFFNRYIEEDEEESSKTLNILISSTRETTPKQWAW